ncbi:MAG: GGDEF domain-containing protein [Gammaproteobacteria bacterium]|nr:GGDEF domain-containing protein [Gammaproteobacteria bacterium]
MRADENGTKRISLAFFVIISVLVTITMSGLSRIQSVVAQFDTVIDTHNAEIAIMHEIMKLARDRSLLLQSMLLSRDPFEWDEQQMKLSSYNTIYSGLRAKLLALDMKQSDLLLLNKQRAQTIKTGAFQTQVSQLIDDGEYEKARILFFEKVIPNQTLAVDLMQQFIDLQRQHIIHEQETTRSQVGYYKELMWVLLVLGVTVSVVIAMTVIHWLKREIYRRNQIEAGLEERVKSRTQKLTHMATHDTLTGLPNRTLFNAQLVQAIKQSHRKTNFTALFFMDLDGFKQINDQHGHDIGDKVLIEICLRINDTIREEDVFARIGGDEFTLILSNLENRQMALPIADKIIRAVNQPIQLEGKQLHLGISIGISFYPVDGESMDTLITKADDAMYRAKRGGKNHFVTVSVIPVDS